MSGEDFREHVAELARRSGLTRPQRAVVVIAFIVSFIAIALAVVRWWPGSVDGGFVIESVREVDRTDGDAAVQRMPAGQLLAGGPAQDTSVTVVVHVAGAVRHPGVVRCAPGSRVVDAVSLAGGLLGNAAGNTVNLARTITDGEMIYVPTIDEVASGTFSPALVNGGGSSGKSSRGAPEGLINLNTATEDQLQTLPGVGPAIAARIVSDREANGPFETQEDLKRVSGIGEKKFAALKDFITVR